LADANRWWAHFTPLPRNTQHQFGHAVGGVVAKSQLVVLDFSEVPSQ
jgi:hypothetical protein